MSNTKSSNPLYCLSWIILLLLSSSTPAWAVGIELHAHFFMKQGMTWLFRGDFNGPLCAKDWTSRLSSQINPDSLERSKLDLIVVTLYAHPLLTRSLRDSIRLQIHQLKKFLAVHPQWIMAKTPFEAQEALRSGHQVIILALEGGSGVLENEQDMREFIDEHGIRIVTHLHLTDDHWGGVAFLKGIQAWSSPWAYLQNLLHPHFEHTQGTPPVRANRNGLTEFGRNQLKLLLKHHIWIDFAHASDASQEEMKSLLPSSDYPLLYTHTVLRRFLKAERGISDSQLHAVAKSRGYLGLMPSEDLLAGTTGIAQEYKLNPNPECQAGLFALATQYQTVASLLGESSVGLGSDYNGGIRHLKPTPHCKKNPPPVRPLHLQHSGLWEIGQSWQLWEDLATLGAWHPKSGSILEDHSHAQTFIDTWIRAWKSMDTLHQSP